LFDEENIVLYKVLMNSETITQTKARKAALDKLKEQGWSVRHAAEYLGYSLTHLTFSLNRTDGRPLSKPMFEKIMAIPKCEHPRKPGPPKGRYAGRVYPRKTKKVVQL
jgi:hypothetical protein